MGGAMESQLTIRPYEKRDRGACRDLWRELTERHREIYEDASIGGEDPGAQFDAYEKRRNLAGIWVAELDGQVAGMAGLLAEGEQGEIEPVVVRAPVRGRGIGSALLQRLENEAQQRGIQYLSVRPVARNDRAMVCFHRAGFRQLGHIEMFRTLGEGPKGRWKPGVRLHGCDFRY
ncbi:MAG: GNAT family N-acetyltransferase [Candidatus Eisenbacteria bacterium]|nr:GNAT family N-acetyltransferase [Candidatus Eisenbacteria bacterium]